MFHNLPSRAGAVTLAVLITGGLAACGDDSSDASTTSTTKAAAASSTSTAPAAGGLRLSADGCDAFAALTGAFVSDPTTAAEPAAALVAAAPAALADDAKAVASAFEHAATDESALGSPEFTAGWSAVGDAAFESCETKGSFEVRGVDYAFSGLPAKVPAGRVAIRFTNDSQGGEPHELVVVRRLPGTDETVSELLAIPQDQLMSKVAMAGVVFVDSAPGRASALLDLEPGSYIAVCTLPTKGNESDPHAGHGMVAEFEVA
jgi:hypothetical protein